MSGKASRCAVSVATVSYLPRALVLASTLFEADPGTDALIFVPDLSEAAARAANWPHAGRLTVVGAERVAAALEMRAYLDAFEFSCAFKSFALEHALFSLGYAQAVLLDPDIACYSSLEETWQHLEHKSICLTPHSNSTQPADGSAPDDREMVSVGFVNGGFWALRAGEPARACLRWVEDNIRHFGFYIPELNLYSDQPWMSAIPWLFSADTEVIRAPGYNVAYWNLHERRLRYATGQYACAGRPLVFFHFSGFDERQPQRLTRHSERVHDNETSAALARLLADYAARLRAAAQALPRVVADHPFRGASAWRRLKRYRALHGRGARLKLTRRQLWSLLPRMFR